MNIPYFAGRYLLDANGNLYTTDATNLPGQWLGNLVQLAQQKGARTSGGTGGDGPWSTSGGAAGNSSGGCSYVAIPNSSGGFTSASSGCG
ncbi:MAG: hypothetical protein IT381_23630 [Deltaproteobacteria bacterium]|nr:hypothetical protein [Deltaproteobacteria bacterium]